MQFVQQDQSKYSDLLNFEYLNLGLKSLQQENSVKLTVACIKVLNKEIIDINALTKLVHMGFDQDTKKMRGLVWRMLLGYFPPNRKFWVNLLEKNKENYDNIVEENVKKAQPIKKNDHPLSRSTDSSWNNYFKDQQLWIKIHKDVMRTRQQFLSQSREELTKFIFLWCKLNKSDYVQGMNEIAALIFYAFYTDGSQYLQEHCESDSFYCFSIVMSTLKNNFISINDSVVFKDKVRNFGEVFKKVDRKLYDHLLYLKIDLTIFCLKWFLTQMAQDLHIEDSLRIWDTLLCQPDQQSKDEWLNFICVSILLQLREQLLVGQFGEVITCLQNLEKQNLIMNDIIMKAYLLQKEYKQT